MSDVPLYTAQQYQRALETTRRIYQDDARAREVLDRLDERLQTMVKIDRMNQPKRSDYQSNPYNVCDGEWGGFAKALWFLGEWVLPTIPEAKANVYDWDPAELKWWRVWDQTQKLWRDLTEQEIAGLQTPSDWV